MEKKEVKLVARSEKKKKLYSLELNLEVFSSVQRALTQEPRDGTKFCCPEPV